MRIRSHGRVALLGLVAGLLIFGCKTLEYRDVQSDFEAAVVADNAEHDPLIDRSGNLYAGVIADLTQAEIDALDPKLRANAWLLRSFSEWRTGALAAAEQSAANGLRAEPVPNTRDDVLLHLMPALAIDSELAAKRAALVVESGSTSISVETYEAQFEPGYVTALSQVAAARQRFGPATPDGTRYYVEYQAWRILANWREVLTSLPVLGSEAAEARARVDGKPLADAAGAARDAIPDTHGLHRLIVLQER